MPVLKILTNLTKDKIPNGMLPKLITLLAELVKKDAARITCIISTECSLSMGGNTDEPAIVSTLESIGNLGPDDNKRIIKGLSEFIEKELKVKSDRFLLTFYDLKAYEVGKSGTTADTW
ncbi:macrophage migration inhibitory factor-like [Aricia agestis]|uniref:macrophage migration inhibitory factor-like n=1 Tax=Aricia agestis TaxID=91739 RepID=UPI001C205442|nr:macrophage migration inhibitory factor-like [Aricia agestis]